MLFVHVDPVCIQTTADGTVRSVDPSTRGLSTGWTFGTGTTSSSSSFASSPGVEEEHCSSDSIVVGEALASLLIVGATIELGRRWPRGAAVRPGMATRAVPADGSPAGR